MSAGAVQQLQEAGNGLSADVADKKETGSCITLICAICGYNLFLLGKPRPPLYQGCSILAQAFYCQSPVGPIRRKHAQRHCEERLRCAKHALA
jgi:hypothetical protein